MDIVRIVVLALFSTFAFMAIPAPAEAGCSFDSDCKGNGKCSGGTCGNCGFDSDCKGNGKCKGGKCGSCGFDSDCNIGKCKSNRCGSCGFDSDCKGGKCSSNKCTNYPSATELFIEYTTGATRLELLSGAGEAATAGLVVL
jgi:hypothetical protein